MQALFRAPFVWIHESNGRAVVSALLMFFFAIFSFVNLYSAVLSSDVDALLLPSRHYQDHLQASHSQVFHSDESQHSNGHGALSHHNHLSPHSQAFKREDDGSRARMRRALQRAPIMEEPHLALHARAAKSIKSMSMNSLSGKDLNYTPRSRAARKSKRDPSPSHGNSTMRWTRARTKDSKRTTNRSKRGRAKKDAARRMFKEAVAKKKAARVVVFSIRKDGTAGGISSKRDLPPSPPLEQANKVIDPQRHMGSPTTSTTATKSKPASSSSAPTSTSITTPSPAKNNGAAAGQLQLVGEQAQHVKF